MRLPGRAARGLQLAALQGPVETGAREPAGWVKVLSEHAEHLLLAGKAMTGARPAAPSLRAPGRRRPGHRRPCGRPRPDK
ncbi:hypothetical protein [[Kitasatospora] papulosa]|uniref:hypothetical protein n=1 Tax=[Kitasatospora] papulosa TaxID=1464011 RepID=UPI0036A69B3C